MTADQPNDQQTELVSSLVAAGTGDATAFRHLYSLTSAKLFGICLRICGERQAAEDVLQEVYTTIWRKAAGYEPGRSSPITWLATIARNRAIDWRRAHGRHPPLPAELPPEPADNAPIASERMMQEEEQHRLQECMKRLGDEQRVAIRTAFLDGLTYAELAERRNVPLGTMKSWIRRGLLSLRECLDDDT